MGNTYDTKLGPIFHTLNVEKCSYIKMLNVPSMLDISGNKPDPIDEHLMMSTIDFPTLNVISKFAQRNNLGSDLAEKDDEEKEGIDDAFYKGVEDDDPSASDEEDHAVAGSEKLQVNPSVIEKGKNYNQYIAKKIVADDSAVSQLRKALQSLHINQRVVSATITFKELDAARQRFEPAVSIDSVPYKMAD